MRRPVVAAMLVLSVVLTSPAQACEAPGPCHVDLCEGAECDDVLAAASAPAATRCEAADCASPAKARCDVPGCDAPASQAPVTPDGDAR